MTGINSEVEVKYSFYEMSARDIDLVRIYNSIYPQNPNNYDKQIERLFFEFVTSKDKYWVKKQVDIRYHKLISQWEHQLEIDNSGLINRNSGLFELNKAILTEPFTTNYQNFLRQLKFPLDEVWNLLSEDEKKELYYYSKQVYEILKKRKYITPTQIGFDSKAVREIMYILAKSGAGL